MSLYPFINPQINTSLADNTQLPLYKEYGWDFTNDKPLLENNDFKLVYKNEAIKVWIYHAIKTFRYAYSIYTDDFGTELDTLLGQKYTKGVTCLEANRYIEEALMINPYIKKINFIDTTFNGDVLNIRIKINTIYEEMEVTFNV